MPGKVYSSMILNASNIGHDAVKWAQMPDGTILIDCNETVRADEQEFEIVFGVAWGKRREFLRWCLGFNYTKTTQVNAGDSAKNVTTIFRENPLQHPEYPWCYAREAECIDKKGAVAPDTNSIAQNPDGTPQLVDKNGDPGNPGDPGIGQLILPMVKYEDNSDGTDGYMYYRVRFAPVNWEVRSDTEVARLAGLGASAELWRNCERYRELNVRSLPMQSRRLLQFWDPAMPVPDLRQLVPENAASLLVPMTDVQIILHEWPDLNLAAFEKCTGRINNAVFDTVRGGGGFPKWTLLCYSPKYREARSRSLSGHVQFNITFHFQKMSGYGGPPPGDPTIPRTWNHFPFGGDGGFYLAEFDPPVPAIGAPVVFDINRAVYKEADFDELLQLPFPPTVWQ